MCLLVLSYWDVTTSSLAWLVTIVGLHAFEALMTSFAAEFVCIGLRRSPWEVTACAIFVRNVSDFECDVGAYRAYDMKNVVFDLDRHVFQFEDHYSLWYIFCLLCRCGRQQSGLGSNMDWGFLRCFLGGGGNRLVAI